MTHKLASKERLCYFLFVSSKVHKQTCTSLPSDYFPYLLDDLISYSKNKSHKNSFWQLTNVCFGDKK